MKARIVINTKPETVIDLGSSDLGNIASNLPDQEGNAPVFTALAGHPASYVREQVATKEHLSEAALNKLIGDVSVNVLRNVVGSQRARTSATTEQLLAAIARDVDAAENIARSVESYDNADTDKLADALMTHTDPKVRTALANNSSAPKKFLKALLKDEEPDTRAAAKSSLP